MGKLGAGCSSWGKHRAQSGCSYLGACVRLLHGRRLAHVPAHVLTHVPAHVPAHVLALCPIRPRSRALA
eukprot:1772686-Rhodomonas_salina.1